EVAPDVDGVADADADWTPVTLPSREPVVNSVVGRWDTTRQADGIYRLRVRVSFGAGQVRTVVVAPIRVANDLALPQVAAEATPIPLVPLAPTTQPGPTEPPTPVPTPTVAPRPTVVNDLPIPVGGHIQNFNDGIV